MKILLFLLSIRLFAYVPGCATSRTALSITPAPVVNNYITPCDSKIESATNTGYQEGVNQGKAIGNEEGRLLGYKDGFGAGRREGFRAGHAVGADSVISVLEKLKDPKFDPAVILYYKGVLGDIATMKHNIEQDALARGKELGERPAYAKGYKDGYNRAFDSLFDARIQHGKMVKYPEISTRVAVNFKMVATLLHQINGKDKYVEASDFSAALWEIHSEILKGLTIVLETTPEETMEVMDRYQKIHQSLSDEYYRQYRNRCQSEIRDYSKNFYDYRYYHSVDAFFDIVESGLCPIADMAFTYAKNSHSYCTSQGFKVMGNICEILIGKVMLPVRDYTLKYGIMRDFEQNLPAMTNAVKKMLDSTVADIRTNSKVVKTQIALGSGVTATVTMEIVTQLALGFKSETFHYETIHDKQEMEAHISAEPNVIRVLKQDYKVLNVEYNIVCNTPPCASTITLSTENLQAIFNRYKEDPFSMPESKHVIEKNVGQLLVPVIIKVAEPALALPHSCYNLVLYYGKNKPQELVQIECENAVNAK